MYLGDSLGKLFSINIKNGARIKKFKKHGDEVTGVVYWPERRFLISCSWDTKVHIHDDSKSDPVGIIRHDKI